MTDEDHRILRAADLPVKMRRAVAAELGISSARFHQRLVALLEHPEAARAYPSIVNRHRRAVQARREARTGRL